MNCKCKICSSEFNNMNGLSKHLSMLHKITLLDYYVKYENFKIPTCPYCSNNRKQIRGLVFYETCTDNNCVTKKIKSRKTSDNTKSKISIALKLSHKNGNHKGWSFINNDVNRRSYPEKFFINLLNNNELYSKYTIKEKMPFSKYALDFAFLEIKTDVEIDGKQHFATKKAIIHDIERDNYLLNNGWNVYRISWVELKNNPQLIIENFLNWLNENDNHYHKYNVEEISKILNKYNPVYGSIDDYYKARKNKLTIKNNPKIELLLNSKIDFSKFGWVKKASELLNIHHGKVNKWMKLYMSDFYKTKCFIRNK